LREESGIVATKIQAGLLIILLLQQPSLAGSLFSRRYVSSPLLQNSGGFLWPRLDDNLVNIDTPKLQTPPSWPLAQKQHNTHRPCFETWWPFTQP